MSAHAVDFERVLARDNVYLPEGWGRGLSGALAGLGGLLIGATILAGLMGSNQQAAVALHAYHVGFLCTLGFSLAALGFVMILHQVNAGWSATIRRQFENLMVLVWVPGVLFLVGLGFQLAVTSTHEVGKDAPYLYTWMNKIYVEGDILYTHKQGYLNEPFFLIRAALYFMIWLGLSFMLWGYSTRQDEDGDRWHTARARTLSAVGLLAFAFTTAFAGFDWIMALDYHWFSTMFGVYFFAVSMVSALALGTLVLLLLRSFGRLHGAFTDEHLHDLSKLIFAFTVFWAYIGFSQYFLIWYANIPEETAWMVRRKEGPWEAISWALPIGKFIIPFLLLLPRPNRRKRSFIAVACVWMLVMGVLDLYWAVRPEVKVPGEALGTVGPTPIDIMAVAGPILVFLGMLVRRVGAGPLVPLQDPRLREALEHKNWV